MTAINKGLFKKGHPGGPGNPYAAKMAKCRAAFLEWVDPANLAQRWAALDRCLLKVLEILLDPEEKITNGERCALLREARETLERVSDRCMGRPTPYLEVSESEEDKLMRFAETLDGADPREIASGILGFLRGERGSNGNGTPANGNGQH